MKVLLLTRYGPMGASSRMRTYQYLPAMQDAGWETRVSPLVTDERLLTRYQDGSYGLSELLDAYRNRLVELWRSDRFDLVWIEKEALPWLPSTLETALLCGVPYVMDFDDAVFHGYDLHRSRVVRALLGRRLDRVMRNSSLVVAGNRYLAERARCAGAPLVEVLPTVVDANRYRASCKTSVSPLRIVWIGSPSTARYLQRLERPLARLGGRIDFRFRVIGAGEVRMPGVDVESVSWSEATEADCLAECDVGVMPLDDTPWEQGKCAYKVVQYMACALPSVVSPVGANCEVVSEGETGYFASSDDEWLASLETLLMNASLRKRLGAAARSLVETRFCLQVTAPKLMEVLSNITPAGLVEIAR